MKLNISICALIIFLFSTNCWSNPVTPEKAAIASAHPLATQAGMSILEQGGNAFDAAVAVTAALAVVEPTGSGLGGGGFWLIHEAKCGRQVMIDGREMAPGQAHRDMYLDEEGNVIPKLSIDGPLAAGIPGTPAAMVHLAKQYGTLPLAKTLAPAIQLAKEGFEVEASYQRMAGFRLEALRQSPEAAHIFLEDGEVPADGFIIKQPDLANTLELIAQHGVAGFYEGEQAEKLVNGVQQAGGIWTLDDLKNYQIKEREPIRGEYLGINITSAAPPSSGGIVLTTMLNILAGYDLQQMDEVERTHLIVEAMRRAYRDRAQYLGDSDYVDFPTWLLISKAYAAGLRAGIHPTLATPSKLLPGTMNSSLGADTTHFSIIDSEGNRVASTMSINYPFGSAFVAPGTGVLLNDEMDDFSSKPGVPNVYGLVGAEANAIEAGKRPLSSMTPTFLESDDKVAILGTPGGSRIITMLLLATLEFAEGKSPQDWVSRPRFHHQYLPDHIQYEEGALDKQSVKALEMRGHKLTRLNQRYGNMQGILWNKKTGELEAASDPRGIGAAEVR